MHALNVTKAKMKRWIKALRSGKYSQTTGMLQGKGGHCCLGVACDLFVPKKKQKKYKGSLVGCSPFDQKAAPEWLKKVNDHFKLLTSGTTGPGRPAFGSLMSLNDQGFMNEEDGTKYSHLTFNEIADLLELVYIEDVFGKYTKG